MYTLARTDSSSPDFQKMVVELDKDLAIRDDDEHAFFAQFNKIDALQHVIVAYDGEEAVGCGAIKEYEPGVAEVKRMYVPENRRGSGIASLILRELETWAAEHGYKKAILETGIRQHEAIGLYKKNGYHIIPNYGQYAEVESSVGFEKALI